MIAKEGREKEIQERKEKETDDDENDRSSEQKPHEYKTIQSTSISLFRCEQNSSVSSDICVVCIGEIVRKLVVSEVRCRIHRFLFDRKLYVVLFTYHKNSCLFNAGSWISNPAYAMTGMIPLSPDAKHIPQSVANQKEGHST